MMKAITSSDGGVYISIAGATRGGHNHHTVHHSLTSIRIGQVEFVMCYPTDNLKQEIEKIVKLAKNEFVFCVSKRDIFHCLVSFLCKNPEVIRLVRAYLSTVSCVLNDIQQPSPKDITWYRSTVRTYRDCVIQLSVETKTCQLVTMQTLPPKNSLPRFYPPDFG